MVAVCNVGMVPRHFLLYHRSFEPETTICWIENIPFEMAGKNSVTDDLVFFYEYFYRRRGYLLPKRTMQI